MYLRDYSSIRLFHVLMRSNPQTRFNQFLTTVVSYFFLCSMQSQQIRVDSSRQALVPHISYCSLDLVKLSFTAFVAPTLHFSHLRLISPSNGYLNLMPATWWLLFMKRHFWNFFHGVPNPLFSLYQVNLLDTNLFCCWL